VSENKSDAAPATVNEYAKQETTGLYLSGKVAKQPAKELISPETSPLIGGHATGSGIQACLE
jgi:hypothetical protein